MRDPARIQRILGKLAAAWQAAPDLRLGQLLLNVNDHFDDAFNMYNDEDDVIERKLDEWLTKRGVTVSGGWQS